MSFSQKVKNELANHSGFNRHCDIAELAGILNSCGSFVYLQKDLIIKVQTENAIVAKKFFKLVKQTFSFNCEVSIKNSKMFKKSRAYCMYIKNNDLAEKLLQATGLLTYYGDVTQIKKTINPMVVKSQCCKRSYLRGAFLSGASLTDPEKTYHLEFVNSDYGLCVQLSEILNFFGLNSKITKRKSNYIVYIKEGENIVDLLNIMGAHVSLMELENVRIIKEMRNKINRGVNCETANLHKTVEASLVQIEDINFILKFKGKGYLSEQLEQVAELRLANPEASLKEIGEMLTPSVGKSGVNHRLRKISEIADNIREGLL